MTTLHMQRPFSTLLCRCCTTTWDFLVSRIMKHVKTRQQFSFSFPELRYSSLEFNSTKIPKTCQIEWNRIRENKRNEVRDNANSIFKWRFRHRRCCLSSLMALRWRRNVDFLGCYLLVSVPLNQCWSEGKHQEHLSNSVEMSLKVYNLWSAVILLSED